MNNIVLSHKINGLKVEQVILNLYKQRKMFPSKKEEILNQIKNLATVGDNFSRETYKVIMSVNIELEQIRKERQARRDSHKITFINGEKPVLKLKARTKEEKEMEKQLAREQQEVDAIYYQRISSIIDQMNQELRGKAEEITDDMKIAWIYNYVYRIPFFHQYGKYRRNNQLDSTLAKENSINGHKYFRFGVFDKYNLLLNRDKTGVCGAKADLFKDLCDFALLRNAYCTTVTGTHMGEGHKWNAIIDPSGVHYIDASASWNGENSYEKQFMVTEEDLRNKLIGYRNYRAVEPDFTLYLKARQKRLS